jgi:hypothetical protein
LKFEVGVSDGVVSVVRRLGPDTTRQYIKVVESVAEARRDPTRVSAGIQSVRGRNRSAAQRLVVLNASTDDLVQLRRSYDPHRVDVFTYNGFLDAMLGADSICEQITSGMEFVRVHQTYVNQSVADESGNKLESDSVLAVRQWVRKNRGGLLVILADAGHGKTSLAREIAYEMARTHLERADAPVPIFVPFAEHRRVTDWAGLVLVRLQEHGVLGLHSDAFDFLLKEGRIVLILDGFDEMSEESGIKIAEENLRMIADHTHERGRVVLTSRSTFFRSSAEVAQIIEQRLDQSFIRVYELLKFDASQRRDYLVKRLGSAAEANRVLSVMRPNEALTELAGSPLVLNMLASAIAEGAGRFTGGRDRASLYGAYFKAVFERERLRQGHQLSDDEQFEFLERIADSMFADRTSVYSRADVAYFVAEALPKRIERLRGRKTEEEALTSKLCDHAAFSTEGSAIRFDHPTFRDFFAATRWARHIRDGSLQSLSRPNLPDAAVDFLAEMLPKDVIRRLAQGSLTRSADGDLFRNVLRLVDSYCRDYYPSDFDLRRDLFASLVGSNPLAFNSRDLSGIGLEGAHLTAASFVRANLDGTRFVACSLDGADFSKAFLRMTLFDRSRLAEANFEDLTQFVSVRVGRGDMPIDDLQTARASLAKLGANVGAGGPTPTRRPEDAVIALLVDQFRRFKQEGRSNWQLQRTEEALFRTLADKERTFVERELVPALITAGFYQKSRKADRTYIRLPAIREAAALIERGELSASLQQLVARLTPDARRLLEL